MRLLPDATFAALLLALCVSGAVMALAPADETIIDAKVEGHVRYASASAVGSFDVRCRSSLVNLDTAGERMWLAQGAASVLVYEARHTLLAPGSPLGPTEVHEAPVAKTSLALAAGTLIQVGESGAATAGERLLDRTAEGLVLELHASQVRWDTRFLDTVRPEGSTSVGGHPVGALQPEPPLMLRVEADETYRLSGDTVGYAHAARFLGPGVDYTLPPLHRIERQAEVASHPVMQQVIETFALVEFHDARLELAAGTADVYCDGLAVRGNGTVTLEQARGDLETDGGSALRLENDTVPLVGWYSSATRADRSSSWRPSEGRLPGSVEPETSSHLTVRSSQVVPVPSAAPRWTFAAGVAVAIAWVLTRVAPAIAALFTRVSGPQVLLHPVRAIIHDAVLSSPGVTLKEIASASGRPYGALRHHATLLVRVGLLKRLRHGRDVHLYLAQTSIPAARRGLLLERDPRGRWLVEWLHANGGSKGQATEALRHAQGISRVGAWKAMRRVERAGLLPEAVPHARPSC